MTASFHIADVGKRDALRLLRTRGRLLRKVPGLRYAELTTAAPLSPHLLPRPNVGRVGLIAAWESERALDDFLGGDPLARELAHGWRVRLEPTHLFGAWPRWQGLPTEPVRMSEDEPAAVLTLGRLRLSQTPRFLRASRAAEGLALRDPALLASTGLARAPSLVATFSLWRSVGAMRAYAKGDAERAHLQASRAHAARPFHHESAFVRFRPYGAEGSWEGTDPLGALEANLSGAALAR